MNDSLFKEVCEKCGLTFGGHHGGVSPYPHNTCPGHQSGMDWENGPGTTFVPSGIFVDVPWDKAANRDWRNDPLYGLV